MVFFVPAILDVNITSFMHFSSFNVNISAGDLHKEMTKKERSGKTGSQRG
jgi:hypothetical protein